MHESRQDLASCIKGTCLEEEPSVVLHGHAVLIIALRFVLLLMVCCILLVATSVITFTGINFHSG